MVSDKGGSSMFGVFKGVRPVLRNTLLTLNPKTKP